MRNYYTIAEAAQELQLSRQRIQQLIGMGLLKAEKIGQRQHVIQRKEVERFKALERKVGRKKRDKS